MHQVLDELAITTTGPGLCPIDGPVRRWLTGQSVRDGLLTLLVQHTSASLTIQGTLNGTSRETVFFNPQDDSTEFF